MKASAFSDARGALCSTSFCHVSARVRCCDVSQSDHTSFTRGPGVSRWVYSTQTMVESLSAHAGDLYASRVTVTVTSWLLLPILRSCRTTSTTTRPLWKKLALTGPTKRSDGVAAYAQLSCSMRCEKLSAPHPHRPQPHRCIKQRSPTSSLAPTAHERLREIHHLNMCTQAGRHAGRLRLP